MERLQLRCAAVRLHEQSRYKYSYVVSQGSGFLYGSSEHFRVSWGGARPSPLGTFATIWPVVPTQDGGDDGDE